MGARETARARAEAASGRELAVLVDGPWMARWYWRDDLEAIQAASRRYPDGHTCAEHRCYVPTEQFCDNPEGLGPGRAWRYRPRTAVTECGG